MDIVIIITMVSECSHSYVRESSFDEAYYLDDADLVRSKLFARYIRNACHGMSSNIHLETVN